MTLTKHKKPFRYYNYFVFIATLIFAAFLCWGVVGSTPRIHDILLIWLILNCLWFKPIVFKVFSPLLLLWVVYFPIGWQFGYPNSAIIAAALETNVNEATEFFDPFTLLLYCIIIVATITVIYLTKKIKITTKQHKFFKGFSIVLTLLFIGSIAPIGRSSFKWGYSEILNLIPYTVKSYHEYKEYNSKLATLSQRPIAWQVKSFTPKYQNYVFVIGESMSRYYMSSYNYPVKTTPFLDSVNGIKYTQFISPAGHTAASVPRLLSIPNPKEIEFQNSILNLAKQVGIKTYWLSNQDRVGIYDSEISYVANHADYLYFYGEHVPVASHRFDYEMLPEIQRVIHEPSDKPKLIMIHLMGSHPRFVKRLDKNLPRFDFSNGYLSDYLSTIYQTDMFLKQIYQALQTANQPFSMVYTSDHGLHQTKLKHDATQFTLSTPLFKLSSDDTTQITNNKPQAGYGFVWYLTDWLGIKTYNQAQNTFLNQTEQTDLNTVPVFIERTTEFAKLAPFDGKLLLPKESEIKEPPK
ncbi:tRNA modification GTPase TrmE [Moraxella macacae 0408225]|uniref:tRNA modification GTPase TrmE n=1 Tax=Moraxella macacae 0408225 TaxID=1230338 RepID=L2F4X8_9GAMM|nr:phosphoethanolamine transferase [Moraxella macacae]ELA08052.1 tRNA modification GTPase TrmE [Moraxella macacae 0408225]